MQNWTKHHSSQRLFVQVGKSLHNGCSLLHLGRCRGWTCSRCLGCLGGYLRGLGWHSCLSLRRWCLRKGANKNPLRTCLKPKHFLAPLLASTSDQLFAIYIPWPKKKNIYIYRGSYMHETLPRYCDRKPTGKATRKLFLVSLSCLHLLCLASIWDAAGLQGDFPLWSKSAWPGDQPYRLSPQWSCNDPNTPEAHPKELKGCLSLIMGWMYLSP